MPLPSGALIFSTVKLVASTSVAVASSSAFVITMLLSSLTVNEVSARTGASLTAAMSRLPCAGVSTVPSETE